MDFDYVRDDVERSPQQAHLQHYPVRTEKDSGRWDSGGQDPGLGPRQVRRYTADIDGDVI